jgi:PAS domain-containing protein
MGIRQIERGEWSLSWAAILVTLLLTAGIGSFAREMLRDADFQGTQFGLIVRGLVGAVLLFDIYVIYQQHQLQKICRRLTEREEFFQLISENVADMIAVVDTNGKRLYNSPSYYCVLGYTPKELQAVSSFEQIHPDNDWILRAT